jgi:hypothetical protein
MSLRRNRLDEGALAELDALDAALRGDTSELGAFVADVRDAAPRPTPAFLAELDARVQDGFPPRDDAPAAAPAPPWWRRRPRTVAAGAVATTLLAVVLAAGVLRDGEVVETRTGNTDAPAVGAVAEQAAPTEQAEAREGLAAPSAAVGDAMPTTKDAVPGRRQRSVERSAAIDLTVPSDEVQSTADEVIRTTDRLGGIVQTSSLSIGQNTSGEARFTLRVPTDRLDDALAAYSKLGSVASRTQDAEDITSAVVSVEDQLSDARAERRALLRALGRADTEREVASVRARLRLVRQDIARLEAQLRAVRQRADLATVAVTVRGTGESTADDEGGWAIGDAFDDAARLLEVAAGVLVVAVAALLPLLALGLATIAGVRLVLRRRRERGLNAT